MSERERIEPVMDAGEVSRMERELGRFMKENDQLRLDLQEAQDRLKQLEPGTAAAIVNSMFDLAEKYGHSKYSSRHALTFFEEKLAALQESQQRVKELENDIFVMEDITKHREMQTALQELAEALRKLVNEAAGCCSLGRVREVMGNTNFKILTTRIEEGRAALAKAAPWLRKESAMAAEGGGVMEWQPIETAPKDGRWFCACDPQTAHAYRARWNGRDFESEEKHIHMNLKGYHSGWNPTLWTYLPDPPWMVPLPAPPEAK